MSSYTNHMKEDDELYRGVLQYEVTPHEWIDNPDYKPNTPWTSHTPNGVNTWSPKLHVPTGAPDETITDMIGPYASANPIKSYITRKRKSYKNLRLVRVEKVAKWEEVDL